MPSTTADCGCLVYVLVDCYEEYGSPAHEVWDVEIDYCDKHKEKP